MLLDYFYGDLVECKLVHVLQGQARDHLLALLAQHFQGPEGQEPRANGGPVMVGGSTGGAMTIVAVDQAKSRLLVLDPHYTGPDNPQDILEAGWIRWRSMEETLPVKAWFNMCLPRPNRLFLSRQAH